MSDDERLMSRVRSAGSVVDSVSAVGFFGPSFFGHKRNQIESVSMSINIAKSSRPQSPYAKNFKTYAK